MSNYLNLKIEGEIRFLSTEDEIKAAEEEMNIEFPQSYKKFVKNYGGGVLFDTFRIYNPGKSTSEFDILVRSKQDREMIIENIDMDIWDYHEVEPSEKWLKGLVPFGSSLNGDLLCWDTHNQLENGEYPIVILDDEESYAPKVANDLEEFIKDFALGGKIEEVFPISKKEKWNLGNTFKPE